MLQQNATGNGRQLGELKMNRLMLLLITACLFFGCGESPNNEAAKTVGDVTKTAEVIVTTLESEATAPSEPSTKVPSTEPGEDVTKITVAKEESQATHLPEANEESIEERLAKAVDKSKTVLRDGRLFLADSDAPLTGWVKSYFKDSEQIGSLIHYTDGKKYGLATWWQKNGHKQQESRVKDGIPYGLQTYWYKNGGKKSETYVHDESISAKPNSHPVDATEWYENGQKKSESVWQRDEDGVSRSSGNTWYENGQKKTVGTHKDGDREGTYTEWHANGQKMYEATFKEGQVVGPELEWYEDGELME